MTVEGTEDEVSSVLAAVSNGGGPRRSAPTPGGPRAGGGAGRKRPSASRLVLDLKEARFFNKPRGLGEISKALEEKGYIYPITTLSGVLLDLVKQKALGRKKADGRWVYGK